MPWGKRNRCGDHGGETGGRAGLQNSGTVVEVSLEERELVMRPSGEGEVQVERQSSKDARPKGEEGQGP